jgi:hypothetical protein
MDVVVGWVYGLACGIIVTLVVLALTGVLHGA